MPTVFTIDPITRVEGHLKIDVQIDTVDGTQKVVDAWATGTMFRGLERILLNRDPTEAPHLTQRICGVCPVPQAMASVLALEASANMSVPSNARILRNLLMGANFLQSHLLHFYHLSLPDYINGADIPSWTTSWKADMRVSPANTKRLVENYSRAVNMTRKAHEMGALFGGRMPHPASFVPGGFTLAPNAIRIADFRTLLMELQKFIREVYAEDVALLSKTYGDYQHFGRGNGNLLAFGAFDDGANKGAKLFKRGFTNEGDINVKSVDMNQIVEYVEHSWYMPKSGGLAPSVGDTNPQNPKPNAYSWIKAPRYADKSYETGPLARMWINGDYRNGISVIDRHRARAKETIKIAKAMTSWLGQLREGEPVYNLYKTPQNAIAVGLTEAPRGALGHWLQVTNGKIGRYQIITPTCWNASPRDHAKTRGPIEQALIGTPVKNQLEPIEVVRVIHSFDPCLSCAVHIMRPAEDVRIYAIGAPVHMAITGRH